MNTQMISMGVNGAQIPQMLSAIADDHGFFNLRKSALPASAKISVLLLMMVNGQQHQWNADTADAFSNKWFFCFSQSRKAAKAFAGAANRHIKLH